MKLQTKSIMVLLLTLALSATARAAGNARLQLSLKQARVKVGQEVAVDVLVKNAPLIYGADVRLVFDPRMLEVVDADKKQPGVQIEPGKFLDPNKSFILQHQVNNTTGTIDYALTLVNPAPPVNGDGVLVKISFRAKAEGRTTLSITEGLFGTRTGETTAPALDSTELQIVAQKGNDVQLVSEGETAASIEEQIDDASGSPAGPLIPSSGSVRALAGLAGTGLAGAGLVSGWLRFRHTRHG